VPRLPGGKRRSRHTVPLPHSGAGPRLPPPHCVGVLTEGDEPVPLPHSRVHVGQNPRARAEGEGDVIGPRRGSRALDERAKHMLPRRALVPTGGIDSPCRRRPPGSQAHRASDYTVSCQLRPNPRGPSCHPRTGQTRTLDRHGTGCGGLTTEIARAQLTDSLRYLPHSGKSVHRIRRGQSRHTVPFPRLIRRIPMATE